jgi:hypothetical protein
MTGHSVIGFYAGVDALAAAVKAIRARNLGEVHTISPVPLDGIDELLGAKPSPVRYFTLTGGLVGLIIGWALPIGSALHYPLIVGGKPLISLTPFGVIAYVCTILFGALFTILGMLISARLPRIQVGRGYDPRLTGNRFGLQVIAPGDRLDEIKDALYGLGAEEVQYVEI